MFNNKKQYIKDEKKKFDEGTLCFGETWILDQ